jgi:hypothetical protein
LIIGKSRKYLKCYIDNVIQLEIIVKQPRLVNFYLLFSLILLHLRKSYNLLLGAIRREVMFVTANTEITAQADPDELWEYATNPAISKRNLRTSERLTRRSTRRACRRAD